MAPEDIDKIIGLVRDPDIRSGLEIAVHKNLLPAATQHDYPGYFDITADGSSYGGATWPGLDSWQMAGAYLLLGHTDLVLDYFRFVRASQRKDGNIPFAIFTGDTQPGTTYLRGLKTPEDLFTYVPPKRNGPPTTSQETRKWIGLFQHWELRSDPLSVLGPICYVLTAGEVFDKTRDRTWLREQLSSVEGAARHIATRIGTNGLVGGSGFYTELPPRWGFDGVTQCYATHAFREMARLAKASGDVGSREWTARADELQQHFVEQFWRADHFGEYVHVDRGLVDSHGLSDTNLAAVAFGLADKTHVGLLWPKVIADRGFWWGGMPTEPVTRPFSYEAWENDPVPFDTGGTVNDVAAMGRVWFLEASACVRMGAKDRLLDSVRRVSRAAQDGYWRERYRPLPDGTAQPFGAQKYCEYPAVLTRIVLGNPRIFSS